LNSWQLYIGTFELVLQASFCGILFIH
jgi:hypothetical protein